MHGCMYRYVCRIFSMSMWCPEVNTERPLFISFYVHCNRVPYFNPEFSGKTDLARQLAERISCLNPSCLCWD